MSNYFLKTVTSYNLTIFSNQPWLSNCVFETIVCPSSVTLRLTLVIGSPSSSKTSNISPDCMASSLILVLTKLIGHGMFRKSRYINGCGGKI